MTLLQHAIHEEAEASNILFTQNSQTESRKSSIINLGQRNFNLFSLSSYLRFSLRWPAILQAPALAGAFCVLTIGKALLDAVAIGSG
jgi:hypothetical protein